jgi:hypothetical protein
VLLKPLLDHVGMFALVRQCLGPQHGDDGAPVFTGPLDLPHDRLSLSCARGWLLRTEPPAPPWRSAHAFTGAAEPGTDLVLGFGSGSLGGKRFAQPLAERWWTMWLEVDFVLSHPKVLGQQPQPLHRRASDALLQVLDFL